MCLYLSFTERIKYLGSIITCNLRDKIKVSTRITIAHYQITKMSGFFNCRDVSIAMKILMYQAIPLNTVLWGCETWVLKEKEKKKLDAFHHTAMRCILGISMRRVREERMTTGNPPLLAQGEMQWCRVEQDRLAFLYVASKMYIFANFALQDKNDVILFYILKNQKVASKSQL
jgi:hypothetical protein